ncbi:MAG: flagellar biosynthesis protein FlhF [Betaproteobacteria bacterium]|jgi:flagellar biosynthesis protein FlhF|nr:flagellar biosynthesis protein FlhF [Betaproteobacteria bacterium]
MNLRKFVAPTSHAALKLLRCALGPEAVVLSTRQVGGQCEILALPGDEASRLATAAPAQPPAGANPRRAANAPRPQPLQDWAAGRDATRAPAPGEGAATAWVDARPSRPPQPAESPRPGPVPGPVQAPKPASAQVPVAKPAREAEAPAPLMAELRRLRELVESQGGALTWLQAGHGRPLRADLMRELLGAGFSAWFAREVTGRLPDDYAAERARAWLREAIAKNLRCAPGPESLLEAGGVFALVGPTGVGKTTTTAKLAARCVVRHGAQSLGLISTDTYRIGAQDQLRIYGRILGVPVQVCHDAESLKSALAALAGKRVVLIDTVGMGQRDPRVGEQAGVLDACGARRVLLLNAAAQADSLDEVAQAYGARSCAGAALTKVDEAVTLGGVLDVAIRHRAELQFITTGQRVPEDLHGAAGAFLAHRALRVPPRAWAPRPEEFGLVAAASLAGLATGAPLAR